MPVEGQSDESPRKTREDREGDIQAWAPTKRPDQQDRDRHGYRLREESTHDGRRGAERVSARAFCRHADETDRHGPGGDHHIHTLSVEKRAWRWSGIARKAMAGPGRKVGGAGAVRFEGGPATAHRASARRTGSARLGSVPRSRVRAKTLMRSAYHEKLPPFSRADLFLARLLAANGLACHGARRFVRRPVVPFRAKGFGPGGGSGSEWGLKDGR